MEWLQRPLSSLKVETLVGGVTEWEVGRVLGVGGGGGGSWWVTGLGAGFVGESGGCVELSYCRRRARAGNAGWVMPMQSPDYFLSSQG